MTALLVFALLVSHASLALSVLAYLRAREGAGKKDLNELSSRVDDDARRVAALDSRLRKEVMVNDNAHGAMMVMVDDRLKGMREEFGPVKEVLRVEEEQ